MVYVSNVIKVIRLIGILENVLKLLVYQQTVKKSIQMDFVLNAIQDINSIGVQINVN